jgi:choline dehydrogenase-like flavoprotein
MKTASSAPNFNYGFPTPGPQHPTGNQVMNHVFFLSRDAWKQVREDERFDYIVIGSGFCALGFVERVLKNEPYARILIIERGPFFLPEHFQNLPLPFQQTLGGMSETFPWTLSARTILGDGYIKWQHGMVPFFGGRSTLWSAWCPRPTPEEMAGWPPEVIEVANHYFPSAERLLNVMSANDIDPGESEDARPRWRPVYGVLQHRLTERVQRNLHRVASATRAMAAPLAVGSPDLHGVDFVKYAVPGPLLEVLGAAKARADVDHGAPLRIVTDCTVTRVLQQENRATALETTQGVVNVGDAQLVLAMGTLPPTTLVLNSFPQATNAGERFTAHFITSVVARVLRTDYEFADQIGDLELAAIYVAGVDGKTGGQYHIQLSALSDRHPVANAQTAARYMPDVVATASPQQLLTSEDYVVFVCAVLGEIDYRNSENWFRLQGGGDPTTNCMLQVKESEADLSVWNTMDEGTFQTLENALSPKGHGAVEYWHASSDGSGKWESSRPPVQQIRVPALVHEGSTLWIGGDEEAPVDLEYRLRGVENVYVTGAGLWPTSGSWNPTMTMVGLAQHLADILSSRAGEKPALNSYSLEATHTASALT